MVLPRGTATPSSQYSVLVPRLAYWLPECGTGTSRMRANAPAPRMREDVQAPLALGDLPFLFHVRDGTLHGDDPLSVPLRPQLGELGAEEEDHRRVVDPDQHE